MMCGGGFLGRGWAGIVVTAVNVAPGGVYDTNAQVTGEVIEESLRHVELTILGAGGALIDTCGDSGLSVVVDSELLATASTTVPELIIAHSDKEVAVLVVFARACVWASVGGVPSHLLVGIGVAFL